MPLAALAVVALLGPPDYGSEDIPAAPAQPDPSARPTASSDAFYPPRREAERLAAATVARPGVSFAPGKGLKLASKDERFAISLGLRTGVLYSLRHTPEHTSQALDLRRLRLLLFGNAFGRHNTFYVQLAFAPRELGLRDGVLHESPALDTYLRFTRLRDATFTVGQHRVPFSRERNVSDVNPLLVDRSLVNDEFSLDRDIGLGAHSDDLGGLRRLRYFAGVYLGEGRNTGRFGDAGLLYVVRADLLPFGLFDDYESSDLARSRRFRVSLGAAYAFHDRAHRDRGTVGDVFADGGTMSAHNVTADLAARWAGWSLDAAYHWRRAWRTPGAAVDADGQPVAPIAARNGQGWMIQTAFLIPRTRLEPALRWSGARGLGVTSMQGRDELGGGLNYYFYGHNLKLQLDAFHTAPRGAWARGEDTLRVQIQINL
ncbi:MAG: hypothetical protein JNL82_23870 [Myxococcales bacterium]|nr:hypothetical protein [Myxococcales bacterium]